MSTSTGNGESTRNRMKSIPIEIKQIIAGYLPIKSLLNFKLSSKEMNYNYQLSKKQLCELHHNQKLFNNATAFKSYLQFNEPIQDDFEYAIRNNKPDIVKVFLEDGKIDPSANDNYAIVDACESNYNEIARLLLDDGRADPTGDDSLVVGRAAGDGNTELVRMLLDDGRVDPSGNENYAIRDASNYGYTEIVGMLLNDERHPKSG
ncbi:hypothetical protein BC833DRAFT_625939 [Globomyces pollinis-pini]|nr:hypothetical protein BC833DRAFT_625939 [Globomyces pollinis-pini]